MQQETSPSVSGVTSGALTDASPAVADTDLRRAFTIDEFCDAYHLSRSFYYRLRHAGKGPHEMRLGRKVMITTGDARDWENRMRMLVHSAEPNQ
ncbi:hypothetical protein BTH42_32080 [Burkholderia sp. SRS-W-2-2016]|uniref:helix-turn-helix domain-containing protein n=1 Tax=Burkholderia sp. SRS-W-2-2016 TaxID=1926878 RepID=UPI00094AA040|nr:helix-turn-helix domain-containing protein [Burkholderia sp. SRS-W-2-2016]OLL27484.1 hypothetical protein BTH42_32080 [Burkholderia sp. SRS-W-2-2016]